MRNKALGFAMGLLFPKRCPFCDKVIGFTEICGCEDTVQQQLLPAQPLAAPRLPVAWVPVAAHAVYHYKEPIRSAILRLKLQDKKELAGPLAALMIQRFGKLGLQNQVDVVAAVPVSAKTLRRRGYNQSLLLAHHLAQACGLQLQESALRKIRETPPQRGLAREQRLISPRGAFVADTAAVAGKRVLLVDDIFTTGSTANECAGALVDAGAAGCVVFCLAAAGVEEQAPQEANSQ